MRDGPRGRLILSRLGLTRRCGPDGLDGMSKCVFCSVTMKRGKSAHGRPEQRAKEHVIPEWLLKHLDVLYEPEHVTVLSNASEPGIGLANEFGEIRMAQKGERRVAISANMQEGSVCRGCNGGWMNSLEGAVRPILIPLIDGTRQVEDIPGAEGEVLTRWMLKTAFMFAHAETRSDLGDLIPREQIDAVKNALPLPDGIALFGYSSKTKNSPMYFVDRKWVSVPQRIFGGLTESYKATLQAGRVVLTVAFWPTDHERYFAVRRDFHKPMWPAGLTTVALPCSIDLMGSDASYLEFHYGLNMSRERTWQFLQKQQHPRSSQAVFVHEANLLKVCVEAWNRLILCACGSGRSFATCHGAVAP